MGAVAEPGNGQEDATKGVIEIFTLHKVLWQTILQALAVSIVLPRRRGCKFSRGQLLECGLRHQHPTPKSS
jgi:hypothetical protein